MGFAPRAGKGAALRVLAPPLRGPPKKVAEATSATLVLATPCLGDAKGSCSNA